MYPTKAISGKVQLNRPVPPKCLDSGQRAQEQHHGAGSGGPQFHKAPVCRVAFTAGAWFEQVGLDSKTCWKIHIYIYIYIFSLDPTTCCWSRGEEQQGFLEHAFRTLRHEMGMVRREVMLVAAVVCE